MHCGSISRRRTERTSRFRSNPMCSRQTQHSSPTSSRAPLWCPFIPAWCPTASCIVSWQLESALVISDIPEHYKIALINSLLALYPSEPPQIPLRALKYSPNITLSFVLLNEDSTDGSYVRSWDIDSAVRGMSSTTAALRC